MDIMLTSQATGKACTKCGATHPETPEFFERSRGKLTAQCRVCRRASAAARRRLPPEQRLRKSESCKMRRQVLLTHEGETKSLIEWAEALGIPHATIRQRLRNGDTDSQALRPVRVKIPDGPLRATWSGIVQRCTNPNSSAYQHYGGRGIGVCERWLVFENFQADILGELGPRPEGRSIDRIDNDGNYEPGNVRWGTHEQQARNRRSTVHLTHRGETRPLAEWAEVLGLRANLVRLRLHRGLSASEALSPLDRRTGERLSA